MDTQQVQAQPTQPIRLRPPKEPKYHLPIKVILIALVFALGSVVGAFGHQWYQMQNEVVEMPDVMVEPTKAPTPISMLTYKISESETPGWKTIINNQYLYSFDFPDEDWHVKQMQDAIILETPDITYSEPERSIITGAELKVIVQENYDSDLESLVPNVGPIPNSDIGMTNVTEKIIGGENAIQITAVSLGGRSNTVLFLKENTLFKISLLSEEERYYQLFSIILSTFRFVDEGDQNDELFYNLEECEEIAERHRCECMISNIQTGICSSWRPIQY